MWYGKSDTTNSPVASMSLILCNSIVLITKDRVFDITNQDEPSTGATLKMAEADEGTYSYSCLT